MYEWWPHLNFVCSFAGIPEGQKNSCVLKKTFLAWVIHECTGLFFER
jgi:hypothetical protein